jgi:indolepyruvate ferredoxin oxidoreductase alpha subunit
MKHVGLNVAADPFLNSAVVAIRGGLVLAVADDPGMHSSQNEQDSRFYADFARVPCLEPSDQQEAYAMTREAFSISERFRVPVVVRLVTRLAHSRSVVRTEPAEEERPLDTSWEPSSWTLLPHNARRLWNEKLAGHESMLTFFEGSRWNWVRLKKDPDRLGILTTGIAGNYFLELLDELDHEPSHLHIGAYPMPESKIRAFAQHCKRILVLEEGYPYVERELRGLLPPQIEIRGKMSKELPPAGELTPETVRQALGLEPRERVDAPELPLPNRPPQLCTGCPHCDSFGALRKALANFDKGAVTGDIGCYTLAALPPYNAIDSCVCMGASIGMAKGAADAGIHPAVAVIGDSTFLHSGITPLIDAIANETRMTLVIMDNGTVGMTGGQTTILPGSSLEPIVLGLGIHPDHCQVIESHPRRVDEMTAVLKAAIEHPGVSVVITVRECIETARKNKSRARRPS